MLKKIKTWLTDKAVIILATLVVSLGGALGGVSYLYNQKLEENASLLTERDNLSIKVESCNERVRTLLNIQNDINDVDQATETSIDNSEEDFSDLLRAVKELERKKDCASQQEDQANEQTEAVGNDSSDIDDLYRVLFRAHCLSGGSGSCDDTGEVPSGM